jgi:hypothetical protein
VSNALAVHSLSSLDTDIVIDLGCISWQRDGWVEDSIETLVKRFAPTVLYGFDPHPALKDGVGPVHGTAVLTARRAAWTFDGEMGLELQGNCTHVDESVKETVACFDLATWIAALPEGNIVLKLDVEGAEYVLLPHLIERGVMGRIGRLLVEWHTEPTANGYETDRASIVSGIQCPIEEWK